MYDAFRSLFFCRLSDPLYNKTGIPQLQRNPYSWTTRSSLLIYDNPAPVGYSYCSPPGVAGNGHACGAWNDSTSADAAFHTLKGFHAAFPEYAANDVYIVGESYAGVYVPMLAEKIMNAPGRAGIQLKGIGVGDGCMGTDVLCGGGAHLGKKKKAIQKNVCVFCVIFFFE